ncbi:hypothetical protein BJ741DRAFT_603464 [Chytriomyces cf. hyalinus JEL632]|nr:hypothetical protein BJ741DRAFT_603464 [Chytriomyces cf. hyalinus JEL632]
MSTATAAHARPGPLSINVTRTSCSNDETDRILNGVSLASLQAANPIISGVMSKLSDPFANLASPSSSKNISWKSVFVVLSAEGVLFLFSSPTPEDNAVPASVLPISAVTLAQVVGKWVLQVEASCNAYEPFQENPRVWNLKAQDPQSLQFWYNAINKVLLVKSQTHQPPRLGRLERSSSLLSSQSYFTSRKASTGSTDSLNRPAMSPPPMSRSGAAFHSYENIPSPSGSGSHSLHPNMEYQMPVKFSGSSSADPRYARKASTGSTDSVGTLSSPMSPRVVRSRSRTAFDAYRSISPHAIAMESRNYSSAAPLGEHGQALQQQDVRRGSNSSEMRRGSSAASATARSVQMDAGRGSTSASGNGRSVHRQPSQRRDPSVGSIKSDRNRMWNDVFGLNA